MDDDSFTLDNPHVGNNTHWRWASASRQGQNHVLAQIECQDAQRVIEMPQGILVATVADGAGSAPMSKVGAEMAVDMLCGFLAEFLVPETTTESDLADLLKRAFLYVAGAIQIKANHDGLPLSQYHTTLSCVIVARQTLAVAQVGDGAVVGWNDPRELQTLTRPDHGEFANSTFFVTQFPHALDRLCIKVIPNRFQGVALTTDGLIDIAFEDPNGACKPWAPFFDPLIKRVVDASADEDLYSRMQAFLGSPKIRESTTDDVTLVIAVRRPAAAGVDMIRHD